MRSYQAGKIAVAAVALTLVAAGSASAASCNVASLNGNYGAIATGLLGTNTPGAGLFQVSFDGAGNLTGTGTESLNGTDSPVTIAGTYTVAKACTGAVTWTDQDNNTTTYNIVLDAKHAGFQFIGTVSGQVLPGYAVAEGAGVCGLTGKSAVFAENGSGEAGGVPVAIVGQIKLNGKGGVSGTATVDKNGSLAVEKVSGTYTEKSDCTGTASVKAGPGVSNFATVVVNGGKELLLIETDAQTIFTGSMQQ